MGARRAYDKNFFKIWSHDMAYILGFLYADGNLVATKRGNHYVAVYTADRLLLKAMRDKIRSTHKISTRATSSGAVYRIQIGSKEWFADLGKLGLLPNKTKRMSVPSISKKYVGAFVRGYFDGDGNVWQGYINRKRRTPTKVLYVAFTSGSSDFLTSLREVIQAQGIRGGGLYRIKKDTYSRLNFSTLDALKLYKIMYNTPCELYLRRKKVVFERFIKKRGGLRDISIT